jgi:hypothetical protein
LRIKVLGLKLGVLGLRFRVKVRVLGLRFRVKVRV